MYRVYNQNFYDNSVLKNSFETNYVNLLKKRAEVIIKELNNFSSEQSLYDVCNNRLNVLFSKYGHIISEIPDSFEKLLLLSPLSMAKIYIKFCNDSKFKTDIFQLFGTILRKGKTQNGKKFFEHLLLDYDYFADYIAKFIMTNENSDLYTINTCFYCNRAYINSYEVSKACKKRQFDLDHFIPKKVCPLFAISLYNFIPSCQICNSRVKGNVVYYNGVPNPFILERLFPTSKNYNFDNSLKFHIIPCKKIYEGKTNSFLEYKEIPDSFKIEFEHKDSLSDYYEKESLGFDIINRYNHHKREFLSYIDKARKYPPSYFLMLAKKSSLTNANNLHEAIFDTKLRNGEKMIFQKIYNDIDSEL